MSCTSIVTCTIYHIVVVRYIVTCTIYHIVVVRYIVTCTVYHIVVVRYIFCTYNVHVHVHLIKHSIVCLCINCTILVPHNFLLLRYIHINLLHSRCYMYIWPFNLQTVLYYNYIFYCYIKA